MNEILKAGLIAMAISSILGTANATGKCDFEKMRHYPMTDLLANRSKPLQMAEIFFRKDDTYNFSFEKTAADEAEAREALERGLKTFPAEERPVLMLATIDGWTSQSEYGLLGFFILYNGIHLDKALATLDEFGLKEHAALFREGRALFGPDYGIQAKRYARWSDGHGEILDVELDKQLKDLSLRFKRLPRLIAIAEEKIEGIKSLKPEYDKLRNNLSDNDRLFYLVSNLNKCISPQNSAELRVGLNAIPQTYADIMLTFDFEAEMLNGSVEQYFYNSAGDFAPELLEALRRMKLAPHIATIEKAIARFPSPYPVDRMQRTAFIDQQGKAFSDWLSDLTGEVDDGRLQTAMIETARNAGILPQ